MKNGFKKNDHMVSSYLTLKSKEKIYYTLYKDNILIFIFIFEYIIYFIFKKSLNNFGIVA